MAVPDRLSAQTRPEHLTADDNVGALTTSHRDQQGELLCAATEQGVKPQPSRVAVCSENKRLSPLKWLPDLNRGLGPRFSEMPESACRFHSYAFCWTKSPRSSVLEPGGEPKQHCNFPFKVNFQHRFCELALQNELQLQEVILVQPPPSPGVSVRPNSEYLCHCDTPSVLAILSFFSDHSENTK